MLKSAREVCVQADVLVCSRGGGGMLTERMQLVGRLWAAGIRAETMHVMSPSTTAQYDYARSRGLAYLVTIEYQAHVDVTSSSVLVCLRRA
jgi:translation initiation factor 2-alpha kinase 4